MMQNYVAGDHGVVYLADGQPMDIVGIRDVQIKTMNGSTWNLQNVRHVLGLKKKLISVGQLDDSGHSILFSGGFAKASACLFSFRGTCSKVTQSSDVINLSAYL
jgi:hypothetical protein